MMAATRFYVSRVSSICPSLGGSPRSVGGSDASFFQMTDSALSLTAYEILCVPFKSEVFIFHSPLAIPQNESHSLSMPNSLGAHPPGAGNPKTGEPDVGLRSLIPQEEPLQL